MRRAKKIGIAIVALLIVAIAVLVGGGCYVSGQLESGGLVPDHEDPELDIRVVAIGEGRVTLGVTSETDEDGDWSRDGILGLEWDGGYARLGEILEVSDKQVIREYTPINGTLRTGDMARVDGYAFPNDPQKAFGLPFEEVSFSSPLGDFPAWLVNGSGNTWVIFVHGKGADRRESLRILPTLAELGLPSLVITYRNDENLPENPDGYHRYGQTEWEDLQGAASYAIESGAEELILVGYSMGGAIVTNFLYQSLLADKVRGAILDAPMLDFGATVDLGASEKGYPSLVSALAKAFAGFRFDIDWGELDYLKRIDELAVPILLFHGDADTTVPVETSDSLARDRPDIVRYILVADTEHVRSWNTDRQAYESAVRDFLLTLIK